ncbi:MAG: hypothetical protein AB1797_04755 [bacterium]
MKYTLLLSPKKTTQVLSFVVLCISLASIVGKFVSDHLGFDYTAGYGPTSLFNVAIEKSISTWYTSFTLLLCSVLTIIIASAKKRENDHYALHWKALSIIFLYLSLAKLINFGEEIIAVYFTWVILDAVFVFIFVVVYFRFLADLSPKIRRLLLIGGTLYIGGAIGLELVGGYYCSSPDWGNMPYTIIPTLGEFFKMMGVVVFIYALTSYISSYVKDLHLRIDNEKLR